VFGYAGDRKVALESLMAAGGWHHGAGKPDFDEKNEGLRRPICDMILLTFHLVISVLMYVFPSFLDLGTEDWELMSRPVAGVDIPVARAILEYNMKRSVFISLARDRKRGEEGLISDTPMESSSYTSKLDYIPPNVNLSSQIVRLISCSRANE
jgi:hypothetical protein